MSCDSVVRLYESLKKDFEDFLLKINGNVDLLKFSQLKKDFQLNFEKLTELLSSIDDSELFLLRGFWARILNGRFVGEFHNNIATIRYMDGTYGYIKKDGRRLNNQRYKNCFELSEGIGIVEYFEGFSNFIKEDGTQLNDKKYKICYPFKNGFAAVQRENGFWNFLKKDGTELNDIDYAKSEIYFQGDLTPVFIFDKRGLLADVFSNFVKKDGDHLNDEKYKICYPFKNGFARVQDMDGSYRFLNSAGKKVFGTGYLFANDFKNGVALIQEDEDMWRFIKEDGSYLSDKSYLECKPFCEGFARVKKQNGFWNYIGIDGKELNEKDYIECKDFKNGFGQIRIERDGVSGDYCNFIKKDGTHLNKGIYTETKAFSNGFALVHISCSGWHFLKEDGTHLQDVNNREVGFRNCSSFFNGFAFVSQENYGNFHILRIEGDCSVLSSQSYLLSYNTISLDNGSQFFILSSIIDGIPAKIILDESGNRLTADTYGSVFRAGNLLLVKNVNENYPYYIDKKGRRIFEYCG